MLKSYIGIDIGKTKVAVGLVRSDGKVLQRHIQERSIIKTPDSVLDYCVETAQSVVKSSRNKPIGIGIGTLGFVDSKKGTVIFSSIWKDFNISRYFVQETGLPTDVTNDVKAAALGESLFGASKGTSTSVYFTISSGVGFCTIKNGKIVEGAHLIAGHIGTLSIHEDGSTLESKFSGNGIAELAKKVSGDSMNAKQVFTEAYKNPKGPYAKIIKNAVHNAAVAISLVQIAVDPQMIVLGGSVANNQRRFISDIRLESTVILGPKKMLFPNRIDIRPAEFGADSGVIGAASFAMTKRG